MSFQTSRSNIDKGELLTQQLSILCVHGVGHGVQGPDWPLAARQPQVQLHPQLWVRQGVVKGGGPRMSGLF